MPHSLSLPFQSVLTPESSTTPPYRTMLSPDELEKVFEGVMGSETWHEVKSGKRGIVSTCGSGMTVSRPGLALLPLHDTLVAWAVQTRFWQALTHTWILRAPRPPSSGSLSSAPA